MTASKRVDGGESILQNMIQKMRNQSQLKCWVSCSETCPADF